VLPYLGVFIYLLIPQGRGWRAQAEEISVGRQALARFSGRPEEVTQPSKRRTFSV
jgi:hypothetical protein